MEHDLVHKHPTAQDPNVEFANQVFAEMQSRLEVKEYWDFIRLLSSKIVEEGGRYLDRSEKELATQKNEFDRAKESIQKVADVVNERIERCDTH